MVDVFISYKREDRNFAEVLAGSLEREGFAVWFDNELMSGDKYRAVIRSIIKESGAAIVVWSSRSVESDFVLDEASFAKENNKLCPVRIDAVDLPFGFGQTHTDDLRGWQGEANHDGFVRLVSSLNVLIQRKAPLSSSARLSAREMLRRDAKAFKSAVDANSTAAFVSYLSEHPEGLFSVAARQQLADRRSLVKRFLRLPLFIRGFVGIATVSTIFYLTYFQGPIVSEAILGRSEPLPSSKLSVLVQQSIERIAAGECSSELMASALEAACRAHLNTMKAGVSPLGKVVDIKNEGLQWATSGSGRVTRFLVVFERGGMRHAYPLSSCECCLS